MKRSRHFITWSAPDTGAPIGTIEAPTHADATAIAKALWGDDAIVAHRGDCLDTTKFDVTIREMRADTLGAEAEKRFEAARWGGPR